MSSTNSVKSSDVADFHVSFPFPCSVLVRSGLATEDRWKWQQKTQSSVCKNSADERRRLRHCARMSHKDSSAFYSIYFYKFEDITFYLADAFIQSHVQSSANQDRTTTERQIRYSSYRLG